ncbi:MAG TPA: pyrroline-5-carboxylate reductase [Syntrophomonadaceae bacterium]|nr:pyrroline-5-carboxylate reductase [Syntrophomonadaceae bacterium]
MRSSLGVIGCGKMAYALLKGLTASSCPDIANIYVNDVNPARTTLFSTEFNSVALEQWELIHKSGIILLAVKPQQVPQVLNLTKTAWNEEKLLISVAAGITTGSLESLLGIEVPIVRVMPNTPCLVGSGVAALCPGKYTRSEDLDIAANLFAASGIALLMEEKNMDAVTAVSGSGPAYMFLVVEAMINAAVQVGLDSSVARQLVLKTAAGSIKMLEDTGEHPAILREQVCSPAGTTIAGVRQLEEHGLRGAFFQAIEKAFQRSIELGKK